MGVQGERERPRGCSWKAFYLLKKQQREDRVRAVGARLRSQYGKFQRARDERQIVVIQPRKHAAFSTISQPTVVQPVVKGRLMRKTILELRKTAHLLPSPTVVKPAKRPAPPEAALPLPATKRQKVYHAKHTQ